VVQNIEVRAYMPEDYIFKQGQKASNLYILAQGEVDIIIRDQFKKDNLVSTLKQGALFGEVALLFGTKRTSSAKCRE